MYCITISDYIFISHSLDHPNFGPARQNHGATLNIFVSVFSTQLNEMNVVIDIGKLNDVMSKLKEKYHYKNLDDFIEFNNTLTTIEFLCKYFCEYFFTQLSKTEDFGNVVYLEVRIEESPNASASYKLSI